jgi:endothelin-converting enzyme
MTLRVSRHVFVPCLLRYLIKTPDGGWIESHPIPGDKGAINSFSVLSEQNAQVILKLLEGDSSVQDDSWDDQLLRKIHILYTSCMDEARLDYLGQEPLQKFVNTIRKLYRGKTTNAYIMNPRQGLSNALGYLHSRGKSHLVFLFPIYSFYNLGVDALFEFSIEGDAGADPNNMILWFSQPSLGLPSKVSSQIFAILQVSNKY